MSSHFIHMKLKKNREKHLLVKTLETNTTTDDKTKSKSSFTMNNSKKPLQKIKYTLKEIKAHTYKNLTKKYNTLPYKYNLIQIDNFVSGKYCHSLASFKEKLMFNFDEEFFKKYYKIKEIKKKIPLFYEFYKSYLQFFCTPIYSNLKLNELIEKAVEKKAKAFYNENYKEEPEKKGKTLNVVVFTSKIRRDLSRRTNLINISKTTILEGNLTNKSSITSANSIAKLFNEIGSIKNTNNLNNKGVIKNKSFNNKNGNDNNINNISNILNINVKKNIVNKKKNMNIQIKNGNSDNNYIKRSINPISEKDKINNNKINIALTGKNNNNVNIIKNNSVFTDVNNKNKKISVKKNTTKIIKIKNNKKNISTSSISTSVKLYINKRQMESKQSPVNYNTNNNTNRGNNSNILSNHGNNTSTNISQYNKKMIQKPNSRNYESGFIDNKNTFTHLNTNFINKINSQGSSIPSNYIHSINSLNNEVINKLKQKKLSKINYNKDIKNILNKNNNIKKTREEIKINENIFKEKNNNIPYKKNSPYKKPDSLYENKNILRNSKLLKKLSNKMNNFNTIQPKFKASNIKTSWNKKDNNILYQKQKLNSNSIKENNKYINQNKK